MPFYINHYQFNSLFSPLQLYTQAISSIRDADVGVGDGNIDADKTMSLLYSERASCFFSNERYTSNLFVLSVEMKY